MRLGWSDWFQSTECGWQSCRSEEQRKYPTQPGNTRQGRQPTGLECGHLKEILSYEDFLVETDYFGNVKLASDDAGWRLFADQRTIIKCALAVPPLRTEREGVSALLQTLVWKGLLLKWALRSLGHRPARCASVAPVGGVADRDGPVTRPPSFQTQPKSLYLNSRKILR